MSQKSGPKKLRPAEDYGNMREADLLVTSRTVEAGMTGNTNFPAPPVDLKTLKADNDRFSALLAEAQDGSKKVVAQKNQQREVVTRNLRLLGRYVEVTAAGDAAIFNSSGFVAVSTTRTQQPPLSPTIRSLNHGPNSGQLVARMKSVPGAICYELHYAPLTNSALGTWTIQLVTGVRALVTLSGLTPGALYAFQARAISKAGYSDWDDSVTMRCT